MSLPARVALLAVLVSILAASGACRGGLFGRQYEYEEDLFLAIDGSATLVVNASIPALVALRGLPLNPDPASRLDAGAVRAAYQSPVTEVTRVSPPWRRAGRRFVQVRLTVKDVRRLSEVPALAWSTYRLGVENGHHVFEQKVGAAALRPGTLGRFGWNGSEIVAFRLHLPSRILWHNARDLETGQPRGAARGNILGWEQHLADRLDGTPVEIRVEMDSQSILHRTLWLFGGAFLAAVTVLALLVWLAVRKGAQDVPPAASA